MRISKFYEKLNKYFSGDIKLSYIFESNVIVITEKEDKVYIFKKRNPSLNMNEKTFLLLSDNKSYIDSSMQTYLVEKLSYKSIIDFKFSINFLAGLTKDGKVYCWECNYLGELTNVESASNKYNLRPEIYKPQSYDHLKDIIIDYICCGAEHILALSSNREVYAWGGNKYGQVGNGNNEYQYTPYKLESLNEFKIKAISSGLLHSMVLTHCGRVLTWGSNEYGQLGVENLKSSNRPVMIEIDVLFDKISCGADHNLLLSRDHDIYVFGGNDFGQLGNCNKENRCTPCQLTNISGVNESKFIDIASHYFLDISVALSEDEFCYIWGKCGPELDSEEIMSPRKTEFKNYNQVFSYYFDITYKPTTGKIVPFKDEFILSNGFFKFYFLNDGIEELGSGSFGIVFKVEKRKCVATEEMKLERTFFAVKKIKFEASNQIEFIKELSTSRTIFNLHNISLVEYFDSWLENESIQNEKQTQIFNENLTLYIKMELCDQSLLTIIAEVQSDKYLYNSSFGILTRLGYYLVVELFLQIVKGVDYLHKHKIIHRDIKPRNIMLKIIKDSYYFVKICDYGIIAIHEYKDNVIKRNVKAGKDNFGMLHTTDVGDMQYAAPEVLDGNGIYDTKADIYSIGRVLLDLLNLDKDSYTDNKDYRKDIKKKLPEYYYLIELLDKMLDEKPNERPDCTEILDIRYGLSLNRITFDAKKELDEVSKFYENKDSYAYKLLNIRTVFGNRSLPDMHIENILPYDSSFGKREGIQEVMNSVELAKNLISIELVNDSLLELRVGITVTFNTPYEGGIFQVEIKVPEEYPNHRSLPKVRFLTNIWHPNICSLTGTFSLEIMKYDVFGHNLNTKSIKALLLQLVKALTAPEVDDLQNVAAQQFKENPEMFRQTALYWTYFYATNRTVDLTKWQKLSFQPKIRSLMDVMSIDENKALFALSFNNWDIEKATQASSP